MAFRDLSFAVRRGVFGDILALLLNGEIGQKKAYTDFHNSARHNEVLGEKTTVRPDENPCSC